jgi:VWFA-related protein
MLMNIGHPTGLQFALAFVTLFSNTLGHTQAAASPVEQSSMTVFPVQSNLVLVPTLVTNKTGEVVYTLKAEDFKIEDNGVEQRPILDEDSSQQPLSLVVAVQTGGVASQHLPDLRRLETMLEVMVGNVPHKIALVSFDSKPHLLQDFTEDTHQIGTSMQSIRTGDHGAAILDGLAFSLNLLQKQPPTFRRAVLLISEAVDHGSVTRIDEALRDVSETNTAIYSMTFSTEKAVVGAAIANKEPPTGASMCYQRGTRSRGGSPQQGSCVNFAPVIILGARLGMNALRHNTSEAVARLTGGEYMRFEDEKSLEKGLFMISNQLSNRYMLSFVPHSPTPGLHTIQVTLGNYPELQVSARTNYWVAGKVSPESSSSSSEQQDIDPR